ncbi:type VI secretion system contractile sheath large subunit [Psychromonas sp. Urea-02u-13]|uniref:type VI secretion system contractile sheath large subunit n=1 Tax=Psychromonas sp. Urea-02u-13 TaxID=2058326 RepID=UPI000C34A887|nr:type VI secretion system contractile sheath large subunit [Psychromonas sp. Urea-02u-13]PKG38769.1 type VI secretion system contractile sheath large subunit [Psychromonas sp. Urea-02u-13]
MSVQESTVTQAEESEVLETSFLEQAIGATRQTPRNETEELLKTLTQEAMNGTVTWDKSLTVTINSAIDAIDAALSKQLSAIMQDQKFNKLEGSWRGLHHTVMNSETSSQLKIRVLNVSKKEIQKDLEKAVEFDQSQTFKKVYESEFGTAGGEPYAALIGDYEFSSHPNDVDMLANISNIAAAGFCPFISATAPQMFGFDSFQELSKPRDLEKIFDSSEYTKWRSFRDTEDSRFVTLTMPRVLARLPYGESTKPIEAFNFEEGTIGEDGKQRQSDHDHYCWMNAAYAMGTTLTKSFATYGWCTSIRGAEGGGKVEGLPSHTFISDDGDLDAQCPTEIAITDRRESELSKLGFLPLCHYKNTDYAVFFGGQTTQKPKKFDDPDTTANYEISARLPYIMATARIAHFLKVMGRDKIGSFVEAAEAEEWLNKWINGYVNNSSDASAEMKAQYPLREANVEVKEVPGQPGVYSAIAHLQPWLQMEELTTSLRLVAKIPKTS